MKRFFKYLLFIVLSIFLSHQISASSPFFSNEKISEEVPKAFKPRAKGLVTGVGKKIHELSRGVGGFKYVDNAIDYHLLEFGRLKYGDDFVRKVEGKRGLALEEALKKEIDESLSSGSKQTAKSLANAGGKLVPAFKSRLSNRLSKYSGFSLKHTDAEIGRILEKGKSLSLSDDVIDDFLLVSCRDAKRIGATDLMKQMDNWILVQKRGYPFRFTGVEEFLSFKGDLKAILNELGIPTNNLRIQGSALRSRSAKDVDLVALVSQSEFDNFVKIKYNGKIKKNGVGIDISNMSTTDLENLADDIVLNSSQYTRKNLDDFAFTVNNKIINAKGSKNIIPNFKAKKNALSTKYSRLNIENIAIQPTSSKFNLKPYLKL